MEQKLDEAMEHIKQRLLTNGESEYKDINELLEKIPTPPWRDYNNREENIKYKYPKTIKH